MYSELQDISDHFEQIECLNLGLQTKVHVSVLFVAVKFKNSNNC